MVPGSGSLEVWTSGDDYYRYVGRWSRLVAREFLSWLAVPSGSRWLDVGCGIGTLSKLILETQAPRSVHGVDPSEGYLAYALSHIGDERAAFTVGNAMSLPSDDAVYDVTVAGLVLNFVPDPATAVGQMARVTQPGGTVAAYVWDYADEMQLMRYFWDAVIALNDNDDSLDEARRFPYCNPPGLEALFRSAGLGNVETRAIDVPTVFNDFDDYWSPFLGGQGAAPAYAMTLSEDDRAALRDHIRAALPIEADGSIRLIARAWAVVGTIGESRPSLHPS